MKQQNLFQVLFYEKLLINHISMIFYLKSYWKNNANVTAISQKIRSNAIGIHRKGKNSEKVAKDFRKCQRDRMRFTW